MNKRIAFFALFITTCCLFSCESDGLKGSEETQIDTYITSKKLVITEKTASGLLYIRTTENPSGETLKKNQSVTVKYVGKLLTDKVFDSGTFSFILGVGQVVPGFDEGIAKMKVGEKATIIFPSSLGYGSQGQGSIPKNSPLLFEIEVLSAK